MLAIIFPRPLIKKGSCVGFLSLVGGPRRKQGWAGKRSTIKWEGEKWKASRLSYHLNCESVPKTPSSLKIGLVLHTCDHDWCVNPEHLYLSTAAQNTKDMYERNHFVKLRQSKGKNWQYQSRWQSRVSRIKSQNVVGQNW